MTLASSAPVTTAMTPGDCFAAAASMLLILAWACGERTNATCAMRGSTTSLTILRAALRQPRQVRPRHRAADIGIRPVERGQHGRGVVDDFHRLPPARASAPPPRWRRRWPDSRCSGSSCRKSARGFSRGSARRRRAAIPARSAACRACRSRIAERCAARTPSAGRRSRPRPTRPRWSRPWRRRIAPPASGSRARSRRRPAPCRRRRRHARSRHGCRSGPARRAGNRPGLSAHRPSRRTGSPLTVSVMSQRCSLMAAPP